MSDGQATNKIENDAATEAASRLARALEERSERLAALVRITTAVASSDDLGNVLQVVAFETARFSRLALSPSATRTSASRLSRSGSKLTITERNASRSPGVSAASILRIVNAIVGHTPPQEA